VVVPNPATPANPSSYLITATAIGTQAADTRCTSLSVDQLGTQANAGTDTVAACWGN
jgi:hypothetical protein